MAPDDDAGKVTYLIPARTISGSVPQILDEIDDMVEGLQIVRQAVLARAPKPACPPRPSWHARLRHLLGLTPGRAVRQTGIPPTAR
jgi:hypothetical protein